jgi:hypothetical protein
MKRVSLILMVSLLAVPFIYAQDEEEEEIVVALPAPAAEEAPAAPSALSGFTVGLNVAMPVIAGEYYDQPGMELEPVFGVVIGTPYGLPIGPFSVGVNVGIESANGMTGVFGILNANIDALSEKVGFPVTVFGGVGMLEGMGIIGGASWDYPMDPVIIKPYVRGTITSGGAKLSNDETASTGWIQVGAMVSYAL